MRPRYALARRRARELLGDGQVQSPPVPVEHLAELCRAVICYEPYDGSVSGMVHPNADGTAVIGVNSLDSPSRRRFTVAHEIGHLLLHGDEDVHIDEKRPLAMRDELSSDASDPREIEANQFAAELLMPATLVRESVRALVDNDPNMSVDEGIETLARTYEVSPIAMTHRLTNLRIISSDDEVAG